MILTRKRLFIALGIVGALLALFFLVIRPWFIREVESAYAAKPVIYLYPEEETEVTVKLDCDGGLTCTYPAYEDGWSVTAQPDGTLTDGAGQTYRYLYWRAGARPIMTSPPASASPGRIPPPFWRRHWLSSVSPGRKPTSLSSTGCPGWKAMPTTS